jgi:hypothetical protein
MNLDKCQSCGGSLSRIGLALFICDYCDSLHLLEKDGMKILTAITLEPAVLKAEVEVISEDIKPYQNKVNLLVLDKKAIEFRLKIDRFIIGMFAVFMAVLILAAMITRLLPDRSFFILAVMFGIIAGVADLVLIILYFVHRHDPAKLDPDIEAAQKEVDRRVAIKERIEKMFAPAKPGAGQGSVGGIRSEPEANGQVRIFQRINCPNCGGNLEPHERGPIKCPYCGFVHEPIKLDQETAADLTKDLSGLKWEMDNYQKILGKRRDKLGSFDEAHKIFGSFRSTYPGSAIFTMIFAFYLYILWMHLNSFKVFLGFAPFLVMGAVWFKLIIDHRIFYDEKRRALIEQVRQVESILDAKSKLAPKA